MKKHAKLGASNSARWLNCPGSVRLSEAAPLKKESASAEEGTLAHKCLETVLRDLPRPVSLAGEYSDEMIKHAQVAAEEIDRRLTQGSKLLIEEKISLSFIDINMFGTVDCAIVDLHDTLTVIDYKYGSFISVDPAENTQLIYYALGLAYEYDWDFKTVKLVIVQPRSRHPAGPIREWELSIRDLRRWKGRIARGVLRTELADAPIIPGEWCMFCPAKKTCPALNKTDGLVRFE
jgi:hypothetical protein